MRTLYDLKSDLHVLYAGARVLGAMDDFYRQGYAKSGYAFLGWADIGFVHILSQQPIRTWHSSEWHCACSTGTCTCI